MTDYEPFQILPALFYRRSCVERTLSNVNGLKYAIEPWLSTNHYHVQLMLGSIPQHMQSTFRISARSCSYTD